MTDSDRTIVSQDLRELHARSLVDESLAKVAAARAALEDAQGEWNLARTRLAAIVSERRPRDPELVLGDAHCACGAPLAHWPDALSETWECSAVLLGTVSDDEPGHDEPLLFIVSSIRTARHRRTA